MLKFDTERRGHFAKKYAFIIIEKRKENKRNGDEKHMRKDPGRAA